MNFKKVFRNFFRLIPFNQSYSRIVYEVVCKRVLKNSKIGDFRPSIICSPDNKEISKELINLINKAINISTKTKLNFGNKNLNDYKFLNIFPGEHYRIINAIVKTLKPKCAVEIGTSTGLGTLSIRDGAPKFCNIITYDIIPWNKLSMGTHLNKNYFKFNKIQQIIGDLSNDDFFKKNIHLLNKAEIIFMDAPKDNFFEYDMLKKIMKLDHKKNKFLILDDIKFVNMIDLWNGIKSPKIDLTSFGHWSGTGLVDISKGLKFKD